MILVVTYTHSLSSRCDRRGAMRFQRARRWIRNPASRLSKAVTRHVNLRSTDAPAGCRSVVTAGAADVWSTATSAFEQGWPAAHAARRPRLGPRRAGATLRSQRELGVPYAVFRKHRRVLRAREHSKPVQGTPGKIGALLCRSDLLEMPRGFGNDASVHIENPEQEM
jgi:hypothetical protein